MRLAGLHITNPFVQAPMAGITDAPFRTIARQFHSGLIFTEMISAEALCRNNARTMLFAAIEEEHHPVAFQLVGNDPGRVAQAAAIAEGLGADMIDINAACPEKNIVRSGGGGALLKTPDKLASMVREVSRAVDVPVSIKIRLGFSKDDSLELACILEDAGASFISMHGRTVSQRFSGASDWDALARVVKEVKIPVLANGGGLDEERAVELLKHTGAEGVMLGRGTRGRPDLPATAFSLLEKGRFDRMGPDTLMKTITRHAELEEQYFGELAGMKRMRKHAIWYLKAAGYKFTHREFYRIEKLSELDGLLAGIIFGD